MSKCLSQNSAHYLFAILVFTIVSRVLVWELTYYTDLKRSPEEGNGNPLQYSCLENPRDRAAYWATVHGVANT